MQISNTEILYILEICSTIFIILLAIFISNTAVIELVVKMVKLNDVGYFNDNMI